MPKIVWKVIKQADNYRLQWFVKQNKTNTKTQQQQQQNKPNKTITKNPRKSWGGEDSDFQLWHNGQTSTFQQQQQQQNHKVYMKKKPQESLANSKEQNKWIETIPEKVQASDLLGKDFKTTILICWKNWRKKMDIEIKEIRKAMYLKMRLL